MHPVAPERGERGKWLPGQSGNPAGRKAGVPNKLTTIGRDLAETHTPEAIATLVEIINDKKAFSTARVAACKEILDRAYGKPSQQVDLNASGTVFLDLLRLVGSTEVGAEVVDIEAQSVDIRDGSAASGARSVANGSPSETSDRGPDSD